MPSSLCSQSEHVSHSMISRIEHELRKPILDILVRIADAVKIKLWPRLKEAEEKAHSIRN
jgi:transcriptional regulator with XRE-family HTH domain